MKMIRQEHSVAFVGQDRHLYLFRPCRSGGSYSAWGFHHRQRRNGRWHHTILRLGSRGISHRPGMRGTRSYELQQYQTRKASTTMANGNERLTYKRFVRFKIGLGGLRGATPEGKGDEGGARS